MERADFIHQFWFGTQADDALVAQEKSGLWWSKNLLVDREIRERFEADLEAAAAHRLDHWRADPKQLLALILLTDQFPRNMYRNDPRAFAFDGLALAGCLEGLANGFDRRLRPIERVFFYLPLEHAESCAYQERAVELYTRLAQQAAPNQLDLFTGFLNFAVRHRDIVARFGRFPHRNAILGRISTPDELQFLQEPGSSF